MSTISCKECYDAIMLSERGGCLDDSIHYLSLHDDQISLLSVEESKEYMIESSRYSYLPEIKDEPWSSADIRQTLRKVSRLRNREHLFTDKAILEVSRILKILLTRLGREILRFSKMFNICTRNEVYSATQIIFSKTVSRACIGNSYQAYYLYMHSVSRSSTKHLRISKSARSGMDISVGRVFRWMLRNKLANHITDSAAVYLTAVLEYLLEEICHLSDQTINKKKAGITGNYSILADDIITSLAAKPDIWRAAQLYEHLSAAKCTGESLFVKDQPKEMFFQPVRSLARDESKSSNTKCFASREEVASIIDRASVFDLPDTPRHRSVRRRSSPAILNSSKKPSDGIAWTNSAIDTLFEFIKCPRKQFPEDGEVEDNTDVSAVMESNPCEDAHPISEWLRVCGVFAKSRLGKCIDAGDVKQAARVLLPSCFCPPREAWPNTDACQTFLSRVREVGENENSRPKMQLSNPFIIKALLNAKLDNDRKRILSDFPSESLNRHDEKGMTILMYACLHGNKSLCRDLVERRVQLNARVPCDAQENDCIPATIKGWNALSFAVTSGHVEIVKVLLQNGAIPDDCHGAGSPDVLSPLHLAAAAGHFTIFTHLLSKRINSTPVDELDYPKQQDAEENLQKMHLYGLAAAHGRRRTLRKLLSLPDPIKIDKAQNTGNLSLIEALSEKKEEFPEELADLCRKRVLKEAMYESVEHGYVHIALEIRSLDTPWNYHTWITTLSSAYEINDMEAVQCLLLDVPEISDSEISNGINEHNACMLFEIFRDYPPSCLRQVASIISMFYGQSPRIGIKCTEEDHTNALPKIGTKFVNNREMADIVFNLEGKPFYGHKIILQNASRRLEELTKCVDEKGEVNIDGIKYSVFEAAMQFLYSGGVLYQSQPEKVLELLDCAAKLQLPSLKQTCEFESARHMTSYNAVDVYLCSKACKAYQLEKFCYHFFLANLPLMVSRDEFVNLLEKDKNICCYLEQEFLQTLLGKRGESGNIVTATYL